MKIYTKIYLYIRFFIHWLVYKTLPKEDRRKVDEDLCRYKPWIPNLLFHLTLQTYKGFRTTFYARIKCRWKREICQLLAKAPEGIAFACSMEKIGGGIFFPHYTGIVINAVSIGNNCTILQGVTLGGGRQTEVGGAPLIGDNVYIGANATIIGGVKIGNNAVVGAGSVITKDVPDNAVVGGNPFKILYFKPEEEIDISGLPPCKEKYVK